MKKIDNRGFVMVETIIVAVFIIGICTFLFANFLPLLADYERVETYDTLEKKYKTNEIRKMILRELNSANERIFTDVDTNEDGYVMYKTKTEKVGEEDVLVNELCDQLSSVNYCNTLLTQKFLNVDYIIVTKYKLSNFKTKIKDSSYNRVLKEYVDYLPSYSKYSSRYDSYYRLIVAFKDGNMANIEVHYEIG